MTLPYETLDVHRWMLRDGPRMQAFEAALREWVQPGCVVLDVGAGSGVLSLLAAKAGATRVYAVERTPVARLARELTQRNGVGHVVQVIEADMQHVRLPEQVDLIVSEWLGTIGVDENLLYPVLLARDRWLKPGGIMVPSVVKAWAAPAHLATQCDLDYLRDNRLGLDLAGLSEASVHDLLCRRYQVREQDLISAPQLMWTTDTRTDDLTCALAPFEADMDFQIERDGRANALVAWFEAELSPSVTLRNAPWDPETHWGQLTLPLRSTLTLPASSHLHARVACLPREPGLSDLAWAVSVDEGPWQSHDTRVGPGMAPQPAPRSSTLQGDFAMASDDSSPDQAGSAATRPQAATSAVPSVQEAASLTRFLARVSVDTDLLYQLIKDPMGFFAQEGLSEEDIAALTSREAAAIEQAMMKGVSP
ncbi:MAG: 50S ribosomal protein L11 methyltransferase [Acidobacteriota bacterium]